MAMDTQSKLYLHSGFGSGLPIKCSRLVIIMLDVVRMMVDWQVG